MNTMGKKRAFEIAFVGLKPGIHEFNFELDAQFFVEKEAQDFLHPKVDVKMTLEKNTGFMMLHFEVGGNADVTCDRCGNSLNLNLWDEFKMLVKMVDNADEMNEQEEDPDVFYIAKNESHLNVENWLYEFAMLSVPMQKMCSPEEMGGPQCNKEVLQKLKEMEVKQKEDTLNPLWKGLDKFKEN